MPSAGRLRLPPLIALFAVWVAACAGCQSCSPAVRTAMAIPIEVPADRLASYTLASPDQVRIAIAEQPPLVGELPPDGRLIIPGVGVITAEGLDCAELGETIALRLGLPANVVRVTVEAYRSRAVHVVAPGGIVQRTLDYRGPERVTELLRRSGGAGPGAALESVFLVRPHVGQNRRPEVFTVDLEAALARGDASADPFVEPGDQVVVGQTRRASLSRQLPPWARMLERP